MASSFSRQGRISAHHRSYSVSILRNSSGCCADVRFLAGVGLDVVQLPLLRRPWINEAVARATHPAPRIFGGRGPALLPAADMREEIAIRPRRVAVPRQRQEAPAVELHAARIPGAHELCEGRKDVNMRREPVNTARLKCPCPAE